MNCYDVLAAVHGALELFELEGGHVGLAALEVSLSLQTSALDLAVLLRRLPAVGLGRKKFFPAARFLGSPAPQAFRSRHSTFGRTVGPRRRPCEAACCAFFEGSPLRSAAVAAALLDVVASLGL